MRVTALSDREQEAVAYFFAIHWATLVLNARNRSLRALMAGFGLVEQRGPLALTKCGKRVMAFAQDDDRPKYPARKPPQRKR